MQFSTIKGLGAIFSLVSVAASTPLPITPRAALDTAEIYYLSNCFNNVTGAAYAAADYYGDYALSQDGQTPDEVGIFNADSDVDYEDGTWFITTPFKFTVFIGEDAYTAAAGTLVGNANSSTFAGPMNCYRETRVVLYEPEADVKCYSDYVCTDVSSLLLNGW